jgi:hypothetical protein
VNDASGGRSAKTVCVDPSHDIVSEKKVRTLDFAKNRKERMSQNGS